MVLSTNSKRFRFPVIKLPILGGQLYIVNSPKLISAIERQPNTISFWHVEANAIGQIAGLRQDTADTISHGVGDDTDSFWLKGLRAIHHAMAPGQGVNDMILKAAQSSAESLRQFDFEGRGRSVDLWKWVTHEITLSHTDAVYGQQNPYRDLQVEDAFWLVYRMFNIKFLLTDLLRDFARGAWKLLIGKYSNLFARSSYLGRERVVTAFARYFETFGSRGESDLTKARVSNMANLEVEDMARLECVNGLAILANTVPSAFWTLVQIYGQPNLLQRVRDLANNALVKERVTGVEKRTVNLTRLQGSLEIQSIIQEVIRLRTTGIGPRLIREDVVLQEQYLLKRGSTVIIPNRAIHLDAETWGSSVETFDEKRFSKLPNKPKVPFVAYRGFGGGVTICPGKHFAIEGIAVFVTLLVLRYDLRPTEGTWTDLEQDMTDMSLQLGSPKGAFLVDFMPCERMDAEWSFKV